MRPLLNIATLRQAMQHAKHGATGFSTNFFTSNEQTQRWIDQRILFYIDGANGLLILKCDRDFYHLYHLSADLDALGILLKKLDESIGPDITLTTDLIGRNNDVKNLVSVYSQNGFTPYILLFRMVRLADLDQFKDDKHTAVSFAEHADAIRIFELLDTSLNRFAEQIPELEEIEKAIINGNILLSRFGQDIGGVLFFQMTGLTSVIRYWFVNNDFRNQGIGARLIKTYFRICHDKCKRITLWVISDNEEAIKRYRHYGFQRDTILDQIMMRKQKI